MITLFQNSTGLKVSAIIDTFDNGITIETSCGYIFEIMYSGVFYFVY